MLLAGSLRSPGYACYFSEFIYKTHFGMFSPARELAMNGTAQQIKHVVVLMFENRSFDHLFGAFPGANGLLAADGELKPEIYNLADPTQPQGPSNQTYLPTSITSDVRLLHDFDHNFGNGMMQELFGPGTTGWQAGGPVDAPAVTYPPINSGFVSTPAYNVNGDGHTSNGPQAMSYFQHGALWVLHSLASEFVLCDNWFCDMPADTLLNRYFMHTAQTGGVLTDDQGGSIGVQTIFDQITGQPSNWKMYAPWAEKDGQLISNTQIDSRFLQTIANSPYTNLPITEFVADLAVGGTLPLYSFLMCWLPPGVFGTETDTSMHPNSDIRPGENYLAAVYNALRNSPRWNDTLLIVTFDENGGMYDHVAPPVTTAPAPGVVTEWDQYLQKQCTFDFTLLGPRIPALLISPWLRSGIAKTQYQNTSILAFIQSLATAGSLTARDASAPSLDSAFAEFGLSQLRTDCPTSIGGYPGFPYADGDLSKTYVVPTGTEMVQPHYMARLAKAYGRG
jgi:phospholipase C